MPVTAPPHTTTMKAAVRDRFGPPDVVDVREVERPTPAAGEALVRVHAAALNAGDWYAMTGRPYVGRLQMGLRTPRTNRLGADFAGTVEAVSAGVDHVRPGDEVFGVRTGAFAQYVSVGDAVVAKPATLDFEEAAAVPVAALTALQGLRDKGGVTSGHSVPVNGASGGVGTFAVQIAKALGAEVTGVCSTRNVELVGSLGADHVVDYTWEDFTRRGERYDVLLDVAGTRSWSDCTRVLNPEATLVVVGGPRDNRWLGPLAHVAKVRLAALPSRRKVAFFVSSPNRSDLDVVRNLIEAGNVVPSIDRRYELDQVPEALRCLGEGHARGKIVIAC